MIESHQMTKIEKIREKVVKEKHLFIFNLIKILLFTFDIKCT